MNQVRTFDLSFQRAEKSPKIIEEKLSEILAKGKLISTNQYENPGTGRLYYSFVIDEGGTNEVEAKVIREVDHHKMEEKVNAILGEHAFKLQTVSVSAKSNFVTKTLYVAKASGSKKSK